MTPRPFARPQRPMPAFPAAFVRGGEAGVGAFFYWPGYYWFSAGVPAAVS